MKFRDETKSVVSKAQSSKIAHGNNSYPSPISDVEIPNDFAVWEASDANVIVTADEAAAYNQLALRCLSAPMDYQGSGFFFHHYVTEDLTSPTSYANYLPALYNHESAYSALSDIISAIGMAGISNMQTDSKTMAWARRKQSDVLRSLNTSLQNPKTAKLDATLMTVMLLGLFELVTCASPQSLKAWTSHINGATAIAKVRGQNQVQTHIGRNIFTNLRSQVLVDCIQRRKIVPPEIMEWSEAAKEHKITRASRRGTDLFPIIARLCYLRAVDEDAMAEDPALIAKAKFIDEDLVVWADAFPDFMRFKVVQATPSESICSNYYHTYPNTWIVSGWNLWRCSRILIHEVIMKWLSRHPTYNLTQMRESEAVLREMNADICASVPFLFGENHPGGSSTYVPRAAAGTNVLWPVYVAATMDTTSPSTRAWCIIQLEKLGKTMGIRQASSLAKVLKAQKEITAWDRFDHQRPDEELVDW